MNLKNILMASMAALALGGATVSAEAGSYLPNGSFNPGGLQGGPRNGGDGSLGGGGGGGFHPGGGGGGFHPGGGGGGFHPGGGGGFHPGGGRQAEGWRGGGGGREREGWRGGGGREREGWRDGDHHGGGWGPGIGLGILGAGLAAGALAGSYYGDDGYGVGYDNSDDDCYQYRAVHDAYGNYVGRRLVNTCY